MTDLTSTLLAALSDGMSPTALREAVEVAIFTHNGLLPLAQRIAPGAKWICDPGGLGYPMMMGEDWFAGVCFVEPSPLLDISVGASPDPRAAGWRRRSFDLADERRSVAAAVAWLRGFTGLDDSVSPTEAARAQSAAACLRALGWS